jgi:hypothetical protein
LEKNMKNKILSGLSVCLLIILSACGPAAAPTLSLGDVEGTAFSIGYTSIALTQAAIPTATATATATVIPPTATFLPPPAAPTQALSLPTAIPAANACEGVPPLEPKGDIAQVRFVNKSKGQVNLSFGMYQANSLGECGIYTFSFSAYDTPTVKVMAGCYWGYAWIDGKNPSVAKSTNPICVEAGETLSVTVGAEWIGLD